MDKRDKKCLKRAPKNIYNYRTNVAVELFLVQQLRH